MSSTIFFMCVFSVSALQSECWEVENSKKLADQNQSGEIFGVDSRCFFSNLTRQVGVCTCVCVCFFPYVGSQHEIH